MSCHGDVDFPGSLPNALRFAEGRFQHGADPYTMYQTLTRGWGTMPPQTHLVPQEKYDVIHYITKEYVEKRNRSQLVHVSEAYLASLPRGTSRGPAATAYEPWREFDYGEFLINTYELVGPGTLPVPQLTEKQRQDMREGQPRPDTLSPNANFAYKGIAVRLDPGPGGVAAGNVFTVFEHDSLRMAGAWVGSGFIDWHGIHFDGRHEIHPRTVGELLFELPNVPGWANPETGSFDDERLIGRDGRRYGPLPRKWGHYRGLYRYGDRVIVSYSVGEASILESSRLHATNSDPVIGRILNIERSRKDLRVRIAKSGATVAVTGSSVSLIEQSGFVILDIPATATPLNLEVFIAKEGYDGIERIAARAVAEDLTPLTKGGPARWPDRLSTTVIPGDKSGAFTYEQITRPIANPWNSQLRTSGLDFTADGLSAVVSCWDGEVWRVDGIDRDDGIVTWRRFASGLFQPLGVKVVGEKVFVICRDQLVALHDLNGDGEIDFYESINSDHQVTDHFHEFAMGLQIDGKGNFYYAKSARHAKTSLVPQHGTLIRVSADGTQSEIIAHGFRAANGVCLNPDGSLIVTDQEGHWNPMNRLNWVQPTNQFYGNMYGYGAPGDSSDAAMQQPLAWVDKAYDRSPAEAVWVDNKSWRELAGKPLVLSYGQGRLYLVLHEHVDRQIQGGLTGLPIRDLPTGIMRGRIHANGDLYVCGLSAWATDQRAQPGGFFRIRPTGRPFHLPIGLRAHADGVDIEFSDPIDPTSLNDPGAIQISTWALERTSRYGSKRYDEKRVNVGAVKLSGDRKTLTLLVPEIEPVWQMQIDYRLIAASGEPFEGEIQNTIHRLAPR